MSKVEDINPDELDPELSLRSLLDQLPNIAYAEENDKEILALLSELIENPDEDNEIASNLSQILKTIVDTDPKIGHRDVLNHAVFQIYNNNQDQQRCLARLIIGFMGRGKIASTLDELDELFKVDIEIADRLIDIFDATDFSEIHALATQLKEGNKTAIDQSKALREYCIENAYITGEQGLKTSRLLLDFRSKIAAIILVILSGGIGYSIGSQDSTTNTVPVTDSTNK